MNNPETPKNHRTSTLVAILSGSIIGIAGGFSAYFFGVHISGGEMQTFGAVASSLLGADIGGLSWNLMEAAVDKCLIVKD
jgi:hypothetical protein